LVAKSNYCMGTLLSYTVLPAPSRWILIGRLERSGAYVHKHRRTAFLLQSTLRTCPLPLTSRTPRLPISRPRQPPTESALVGGERTTGEAPVSVPCGGSSSGAAPQSRTCGIDTAEARLGMHRISEVGVDGIGGVS
jgi:hypothetical protein